MAQEKYITLTDNKHILYEFLSEGPRGSILKVVFYNKLEENLYNLSFGDWNDFLQMSDDKVRSNNHDRDKILATVASTVIDFIKHHPNAIILIKGSTPSRTRLYQIGISANWMEINNLFYIYGFCKGNWEAFEKGKNYQQFIIKVR